MVQSGVGLFLGTNTIVEYQPMLQIYYSSQSLTTWQKGEGWLLPIFLKDSQRSST